MYKKIITNKQNIILTLLLTFRFLNSKQLQQFLLHKDHRRINSWLKDLVDKQYIERDYKPVYGILTKPAVYNLSNKGRAYFKSSYPYHFPKYLRRISRDTKASKGFRIRCQIIADWYLMLFPISDSKCIPIIDILLKELTTDTEGKEEKVPLNILQFFTPSYFPSFILLGRIKPDAYLRKRTRNGITHGLLIALDAYIPRLMLRYLLERIFTSLDEEYWEEEDVDSLHIYILCPNNMIIIYLRRLLQSFFERYYGGKELVFHFATRNQLYKRTQTKSLNSGWSRLSSADA